MFNIAMSRAAAAIVIAFTLGYVSGTMTTRPRTGAYETSRSVITSEQSWTTSNTWDRSTATSLGTVTRSQWVTTVTPPLESSPPNLVTKNYGECHITAERHLALDKLEESDENENTRMIMELKNGEANTAETCFQKCCDLQQEGCNAASFLDYNETAYCLLARCEPFSNCKWIEFPNSYAGKIDHASSTTPSVFTSSNEGTSRETTNQEERNSWQATTSMQGITSPPATEARDNYAGSSTTEWPTGFWSSSTVSSWAWSSTGKRSI